MTLRKRIDRLDGKRGTAALGPSLIFLCSGETSEPLAALLMSDESLTREDGETAESFTAQAETGGAGAVCLPDNGCDALATGKAPRWACGALAEKALREKHAPNEPPEASSNAERVYE